jgi:excisionase family DNA binding protein
MRTVSGADEPSTLREAFEAAKKGIPVGVTMSNEWWDVDQAAAHAKCGKGTIYAEVRRGRLRAARLGGRRELRFLPAWIDAWLLASATPEIVNPAAPGDDDRRDRLNSATH